jgi:hypothetical protein
MISRFAIKSNAEYIDQIHTNSKTIIDSLPLVIRIIIKTVQSFATGYLITTDDSYTLDVADQNMSDLEYHSLLRTIGAHMETLKKNPICQYFDQQEKDFQRTIWKASDLNTYIDDIISFVAAANTGHVNKLALKSILIALIKSEVRDDRLDFNKTENIIIYSSKREQCGVIRLEINDYQKFSQYCCFTGAETKAHVKKSLIIFRDSKDLLHTLKTFVQVNRP